MKGAVQMLFSSMPYVRIPDELKNEESEIFPILLNQHYRYTKLLFSKLERMGLFLGNGGFVVAAVQESTHVILQPALQKLIPDLEMSCRKSLHTPLYYCVQANGTPHIILCYPRAEQTVDTIEKIRKQLYSDFLAILQEMKREHPDLRILISDVFFGEAELYLAANSLHHAIEYDAFLTQKPQLVQLSAERQLHGAFVEDFYVYRKLCNRVTEHLISVDCDQREISGAIVDELICNSSPSMESVHHHIQMFILTLSEQLSTSGLIDSAYIQHHHIVRKCMAFETEAELREAMDAVIGELRKQYEMLTAIGNRRQIQTARNYVEKHITDCSLSVNMLADKYHISPSQLTQQFRRYYGVSLHRFIQDTRLQKAKNFIMVHPDWTLAEVSRYAGYTDASTMYRAFMKIDGTAPGRLRQQIKHGSSNIKLSAEGDTEDCEE